MLIFDKIKTVYLANPKTGTTSFEHAFAKHANLEQSRLLPKHIPFRRFKKKLPELARNYEVVTCVRDPLETLYSWYRYRSRSALRGDPNSTIGLSFEFFFEEWCKDEPMKFARVPASVVFVLGRSGKIAPRLMIFKYQSRLGIADYIAAKLGVKAPLARKNVSRHKPEKKVDLQKIYANSNCPKLDEQYALYNKIRFMDADGSR